MYSKIGPKEVRQIRMAYDGHVPIEGLEDLPAMQQLADHFKLDITTISAICRGHTWASVNPPKCKRKNSGGRKPGKQLHLRKLSPEIEEEIRKRKGEGESYRQLATAYAVGASTINRIVRR